MKWPKRTILVVGMGTSPAVLTETVWELAHLAEPVVPDEVSVIATKSGRDIAAASLLSGENGVWRRLLAALCDEGIDIEGKLVFGVTSIHVIPDASGAEMDDLRTGEDNLRAADFMLGELRKYTESPDTIVLCSIAGGRKTMSALLFSCMTLLGRDEDKVYHVLLPARLERGAEPPFFFPEPGMTYKGLADGKEYKAEELRSELFEVPFVKTRGWYQDKFKSGPPSYRTLVSKVQSSAPPAVVWPEIEIDLWSGTVLLNGQKVSMSRPCFAALVLLAGGCPVRDLHKRLLALHKAKGKGITHCDWLASFQDGTLFSNEAYTDDLTKTMSNLRKSLSAAGFTDAESLVPKRRATVTFPLGRVKWRNWEKLADIQGYLLGGI